MPARDLARPEPPPAPRFAGADLDRRPLVRVREPGVRAGLAFDVRSGRLLWRQLPRRRLPMASLTKLMTALLVAERTRSGETARVPAAVRRVRGSLVGGLRVGRRVAVPDLLRGMMLASGNDAAVVLAHHVARSEPAFVRLMNRRARALGMRCTRYVTASGFGRGNRSCPADLARLTQAVLARPRLAALARRRTATVRLGGVRTLLTTHPLLRERHPGVVGLKTGWSPWAGRCLITVVRSGGRLRAVILLGATDPAGATRRILRAA
jgi:serine-type D-Ala-D-Ala carboxypeptidase (penicillin-binding protein 5/6)